MRRTLSGIIAHDTSDDTEQDASVRHEEPRSWSRSNQSRNNTRAKTDHRPLLCESEIKQDPGDSRERSSQVGVPARHYSPQVCAESGTAVEAEPSKPQENGAESDERDVVRAEVEKHLFLAFAENQGVSEGAHARRNFDGSATCTHARTLVDDVLANSPVKGFPLGKIYLRSPRHRT